jgi:hypothetical protein
MDRQDGTTTMVHQLLRKQIVVVVASQHFVVVSELFVICAVPRVGTARMASFATPASPLATATDGAFLLDMLVVVFEYGCTMICRT